MKAIEITKQDSADVLRRVRLRDPVPGPGQVLIRAEAAAVSFSDVVRRRGYEYPVPTPGPSVPGAKVVGAGAPGDSGGLGPDAAAGNRRLRPVGHSDSQRGGPPRSQQPLAHDPAPSQALTGFNLGIWFEHRLSDAVMALQRLIGWVSTGHLSAPAVRALPLGSAAETHGMLEPGATTGKLVLKL